MEDDPLGSGSLSGSASGSVQSKLDAMRLAVQQGTVPTASEVNAFLKQCETQQVSSETIANVEQMLGALKKAGFKMKEIKSGWQALKGMEARKAEARSAAVTKPTKAAPTPATYSSALGVNIPAATRRTQSKGVQPTPTTAGRQKVLKAASSEATVNNEGFNHGDKVVFAPFCPHRDRGVGTVVFASHSGICVEFDTGGPKAKEWVHNEILVRPGSARGSASRKNAGRTVFTPKDEVGVEVVVSAPAPAPVDDTL